ncbi:hypothetical protein AB0H83_02310 [Dactylosporangium sp. NPDC050688]
MVVWFLAASGSPSVLVGRASAGQRTLAAVPAALTVAPSADAVVA